MPRRPEPNVIQLIKGDPGKRAKRRMKKAPKPKGSLPDCPEFLHKYAKEEWKKVIDEIGDMEAMGQKLMTLLDASALAAYASAFAEFRNAEEHINVDGEVVETPNGCFQQSPYISIRSRARATLLKFAQEFGFTPSARTRLELITSENTEDRDERIFNEV